MPLYLPLQPRTRLADQTQIRFAAVAVVVAAVDSVVGCPRRTECRCFETFLGTKRECEDTLVTAVKSSNHPSH